METGEEETRMVYMLSEILQLTIGSCDLSQAEKNILQLQAEQTHIVKLLSLKMKTFFTQDHSK